VVDAGLVGPDEDTVTIFMDVPQVVPVALIKEAVLRALCFGPHQAHLSRKAARIEEIREDARQRPPPRLQFRLGHAWKLDPPPETELFLQHHDRLIRLNVIGFCTFYSHVTYPTSTSTSTFRLPFRVSPCTRATVNRPSPAA
jgi:hypothetical protein